jgi:hypothetical protein
MTASIAALGPILATIRTQLVSLRSAPSPDVRRAVAELAAAGQDLRRAARSDAIQQAQHRSDTGQTPDEVTPALSPAEWVGVKKGRLVWRPASQRGHVPMTKWSVS